MYKTISLNHFIVAIFFVFAGHSTHHLSAWMLNLSQHSVLN